ncbi:MAG: hypothetical protein Q8942_06465 [Bacillota bacterium]|nr:hypothetical protein [Bacillota bacterium]
MKRASTNSSKGENNEKNNGYQAFKDFYTMNNLNLEFTLQPKGDKNKKDTQDIMYSAACPTGYFMTAIAEFTVSGQVQVIEFYMLIQ